MTLKECYNEIGGDLEAVLGRLRSEALVRKFTLRFLDDDSYSNLQNALKAQDGEEAFRAAHTIKGVSQNLGFDSLYHASMPLTEALRARQLPVDESLVQDLDAAYQKTVAAIKELAAS